MAGTRCAALDGFLEVVEVSENQIGFSLFPILWCASISYPLCFIGSIFSLIFCFIYYYNTHSAYSLPFKRLVPHCKDTHYFQFSRTFLWSGVFLSLAGEPSSDLRGRMRRAPNPQTTRRQLSLSFGWVSVMFRFSIGCVSVLARPQAFTQEDGYNAVNVMGISANTLDRRYAQTNLLQRYKFSGSSTEIFAGILFTKMEGKIVDKSFYRDRNQPFPPVEKKRF